MVDFAALSERRAAVAAISQGQLNQFGRFAESVEERLAAIEEKGEQSPQATGPAESLSQKLADIQPVEATASDAKSVDVRDSVIELESRFNQMLASLKGE